MRKHSEFKEAIATNNQEVREVIIERQKTLFDEKITKKQEELLDNKAFEASSQFDVYIKSDEVKATFDGIDYSGYRVHVLEEVANFLADCGYKLDGRVADNDGLFHVVSQ